VLPNALLAEAIRNGALIKPIRTPGAGPEPRYRPSAELAEFVRMRDLFCRFPGCPVSADRCDIDHVRPWPWGPTHPSNLNCKCRKQYKNKTVPLTVVLVASAPHTDDPPVYGLDLVIRVSRKRT
jgi:hypothetical protein